jgi:ribosome maturation factor RimP
MINPARIRENLEDELLRRDLFLVEVVVRPGNKISIFVDSMKGVTLDECISVSRYLEGKLDRNAEDFELEVSSPGLDKPLKLPVQYEKNTGRVLDVVRSDGLKITGKLLGISQDMIRLETEITLRDGRKGKKKTESFVHEIKLEEIKTAKVVISLKK